MKASIPHGVNFLRAAIDREVSVPRPHAELSNKGCLMQPNGLFQDSIVRGMLERKDCPVVDMVFLITGAYLDRATGFQIFRIWLVLTACIPILCPKLCHGTMVEVYPWHTLIVCAETFLQLNSRLWTCFCSFAHSDCLHYSFTFELIWYKTFWGFGVYLRWMGPRTNTSTQLLHLSSVWLLRCKPVHPGDVVWTKTFSTCVGDENELRLEKNRLYLARPSRPVSLVDTRSDLWLGNSQRPESGINGRLFKMFFQSRRECSTGSSHHDGSASEPNVCIPWGSVCCLL